MITIDPIKRPSKESSSVDTTEIMKEVDLKIEDALNNKADKSEIPTKISQLENDVPYVIEDCVNNGLYIYDTDGRFTLPENWSTTNNNKAVGVAILTDDCQFVVAKADARVSEWGDLSADISTLTNYTDAASATSDLDGVNNTSKIIAVVGSSKAAGNCAAYTFPNGKTGYLGAAGEWRVARQNKEDLNSALTLIGGTTMTEGGYWTSTEYSRYSVWSQMFDSSSDLDFINKNLYYYVRAFLAIERPKPLKERVSEIESSVSSLESQMVTGDIKYIKKVTALPDNPDPNTFYIITA